MENRRTKSRSPQFRGAILCGLLLASWAPATLAADDAIGESGRQASGPNPLKNVYFGEEHMHTRNSFDAFTAGVSATWDDAYNFAKGHSFTWRRAV